MPAPCLKAALPQGKAAFVKAAVLKVWSGDPLGPRDFSGGPRVSIIFITMRCYLPFHSFSHKSLGSVSETVWHTSTVSLWWLTECVFRGLKFSVLISDTVISARTTHRNQSSLRAWIICKSTKGILRPKHLRTTSPRCQAQHRGQSVACGQPQPGEKAKREKQAFFSGREPESPWGRCIANHSQSCSSGALLPCVRTQPWPVQMGVFMGIFQNVQ